MRSYRLRRVFLALGLAMLLAAGTASAAPILSENSHGRDVLKLQQELQRAGYLDDKPDGIFGSRTKNAVIAFQRAKSLKETGVVDRETWACLQKEPADAGRIALPGGAGAGGVKIQPPQTADRKPDLKPRVNKAPESKPFLKRANVNKVIATARKYIGTPYKFGGTTPKAFDCSGYLQYVFEQNGMTIPRTADEQFKLGKNARVTDLEPGDLVFFETYEKGASHCGIYLGGDKFIHASTSKGVRIDELSNDYWKTHYYGGKHIIE